MREAPRARAECCCKCPCARCSRNSADGALAPMPARDGVESALLLTCSVVAGAAERVRCFMSMGAGVHTWRASP